MDNFFIDLDLELNNSWTKLARELGLADAVGDALSQDALPAMLRASSRGPMAGTPAIIWLLCQDFMQAQAGVAGPTNLDNNRLEGCQDLAQQLLGKEEFVGLVLRHAPDALETGGQFLDCMAALVLANLGQRVAALGLDAVGMQGWLRQQEAAAVELKQPVAAPQVTSTPAPALRVAKATQAAAPRKMALWWSLVVLVAVGLASSFFWRQQKQQAMQNKPEQATAIVQATANLPLVAATSTEGSTASDPKDKSGSSGFLDEHLTKDDAPVPTERPVPAAVPEKTTEVLSSNKTKKAEELKKEQAKKEASEAKQVATKADRMAKTAPLAIAASGVGASSPQPAASQHEASAGDAPDAPANSAESLLFKRLTNPELNNQRPINLDRLAFAPGQTTLEATSAQQLNNIATLLKVFPRCKLIVLGHADAGEMHSKALALSRAKAVVAELVKQGVPSGALQAQGHLDMSSDKSKDPTEARRPAVYVTSID